MSTFSFVYVISDCFNWLKRKIIENKELLKREGMFCVIFFVLERTHRVFLLGQIQIPLNRIGLNQTKQIFCLDIKLYMKQTF